MPEDEVQKILVCGDVKGRIHALFNRVSKIMKATGSFDMLFCVGDFFGEKSKDFEDLVSGQIKVSVPTFLVSPVPEYAKQFISDESSDVCQNVTYLGSCGTYTSMSGLRIVYLSEQKNSQNSPFPSNISSEVLKAENYGFMGVDLLLTCQWPKEVEKRTAINTVMDSIPEEFNPCIQSSSSLISRLAYIIRPRYHFSSGKGFYYERAPYRNHRILQEKACHTTRFIALADVKNPHNHKYMYALKLIPIDKMEHQDLINQPPDVTENPYLELFDTELSVKDKEIEVQTEQYFYNLTSSNQFSSNHGNNKRHSKKRLRSDTNNEDDSYDVNNGLIDNKRSTIQSANNSSFETGNLRETIQQKIDKPREQAACWFCLGNPQVKKHLIISVGNQVYLAMPRGPVVPDHILILTIGHHQNWIVCPPYVRKEIEEYKLRLKQMYASQGKAMVAFERNLKTQHYQLQVIPVPFPVAAEVKQVFLDLSVNSESSPCELKPIPRNTEIDEICGAGIPYFYVELPTGEKLFGKIPKDRIPNVDLQFGRAVLTDSRILNCPDKADWRDCTDDEQKETELTLKLREEFSPYDLE